MGWLDDAVKVLQLISLPIVIVVTLYGAFSQYLTEFWRGFMLGVLVVLLPMLIINIYLARKDKATKQKQPIERKTTDETIPQVQTVVSPPKDELLRILREFTNRWEQYKQLDDRQKWVMGLRGDIQGFAKEASDRLLALVSKYAESWDFSLRNQVQIISSDLRKLALESISPLGSGTMLTDMEKQAEEAYQRAQALVSFLAPKETTR